MVTLLELWRVLLADSTKAEVMGLLIGLREARDLNLSVSLVEGDS